MDNQPQQFPPNSSSNDGDASMSPPQNPQPNTVQPEANPSQFNPTPVTQSAPMIVTPTISAQPEPISNMPVGAVSQHKSNRLTKALKICIILQIFFLVASLLYGHFVTDSNFDQYVTFLLWIFSGFTVAVIVLM